MFNNNEQTNFSNAKDIFALYMSQFTVNCVYIVLMAFNEKNYYYCCCYKFAQTTQVWIEIE